MSNKNDSVVAGVKNILLVEDEELSRKNLQRILDKEGYNVVSTGEGSRAQELLFEQEFDLVITDLKMPNVDGMQLLEETKRNAPYTEVILITAYATVDSAVEAMKEGAYYYLAKPYKIDEVRKIVREAMIKRDLTLENLDLKNRLEENSKHADIVSNSKEMNEALQRVRQIAPTDSNVMILGESGTGKELLAKEIHYLSNRSEQKFVAFNCGSFTEELMANELFGHEKGAYTGANSMKKGLLEVADGGTVFLDEVGDMPLSMQVKLLRIIQEQEFIRVGGVEPHPVNIRFISATHRDLKQEVEAGRFRQDLYYRLNVISLTLPPLVDRKGDVSVLANHFLAKKMKEMNKHITSIDPDALELLESYSWPGNVRELENVIERAVALTNREVIKADVLPEYIRNLSIETLRRHSSRLPTLEEQEIDYIRRVLRNCKGNKSKAAQVMGIDRVSLWRKIKRYKLEE